MWTSACALLIMRSDARIPISSNFCAADFVVSRTMFWPGQEKQRSRAAMMLFPLGANVVWARTVRELPAASLLALGGLGCAAAVGSWLMRAPQPQRAAAPPLEELA